jgi:hypothetical protein
VSAPGDRSGGHLDARWVTVAFTWNGLRALGVDEESLATFARSSVRAARASILGDTGPNHPDNWVGGLASPDLHAIVILSRAMSQNGSAASGNTSSTPRSSPELRRFRRSISRRRRPSITPTITSGIAIACRSRRSKGWGYAHARFRPADQTCRPGVERGHDPRGDTDNRWAFHERPERPGHVRYRGRCGLYRRVCRHRMGSRRTGGR